MSLPPGQNLFREYKGDCTVFIETGTYMGEGMVAARDAGFLEIHSIDIVEHPDILFKYDGVGTAKRYIDDSRKVLPWLLPKINGKVMFWLDAHSMLIEGEEDNFPLMGELEIIYDVFKYKDDKPVILIDDFLYMSHPDVTGYGKNEIECVIRAIGPYNIQYLPNPIKNNILLAYV